MNSAFVKRLAVIGDPISHSLSPLMQNAALQQLGLPIIYEAIRVSGNELKNFVQKQSAELLGFNVTIPHKTAIIPWLGGLSQAAQRIGAVNTVVKENNQWVGHNTDGAGYLASLQEEGLSVKQQNITLLGAGGAARAIAVAIADHGAKSIHIANRTQENAKKLAETLASIFPSIIFSISELQGADFEARLEATDLLVNTTSVGLKGRGEFSDFPWSRLKASSQVSDIVYRPRFTQFLQKAQQNGHKIHSGEGMLVHQGALALTLWTGRKPDVTLMRKVLLNKLNEED